MYLRRIFALIRQLDSQCDMGLSSPLVYKYSPPRESGPGFQTKILFDMFYIYCSSVCMQLWLRILTTDVDTVKPVLNGHSKIDKTKILMTNGSIMKVQGENSAILLTCIKQ